MTNNSALPKISMPNVGSLERTYSTPWKFELPKEEAKAEEKTRDIALPLERKKKVFPISPDLFNLIGLEKMIIQTPMNGLIYKWHIPGNSKATIFEWDQDLRNTQHYHVMSPFDRGVHNGIHYYPGDPIPPPYDTIYFP
jgi:hypothetical protein